MGTFVGEIAPWGERILKFLNGVVSRKGGTPFTASLIWNLIKVLVVLHIILINALFLVWWERKISAHIQTRLGPMYVGGWHGWAQTIADGIKLLLKEDAAPQNADFLLHRLAPAVVVIPALLAFAPVSFGQQLAAADIDIGTLYIF
ncbi:MAG: NADH-quinone oxidoreductase subunit H, partial [Elusimicrobia bacterium]|nr:NADH-quinone oxidoreductase subunit H [Elusimicrobiota bacterium]